MTKETQIVSDGFEYAKHELEMALQQRDELLAACRSADAYLNDTTAVRAILRAAIAKIERANQ